MSRYFMMHTQALAEGMQRKSMIDEGKRQRSVGAPAIPPDAINPKHFASSHDLSFAKVKAAGSPKPKKDRFAHDFQYRTASRAIGNAFERSRYLNDQRSVNKGRAGTFTLENGVNEGGVRPIYPYQGNATVKTCKYLSTACC